MIPDSVNDHDRVIPPEVSVVIPCRNAADTLPEQLEALAAQLGGVRFEVIVSDNGSTDGSREVALSFSDRFYALQVVSAREGRGAGYARNEGVQAARSDKILFCDADDVASGGWVSAMSRALDEGVLVGGGRDFSRLNSAWHPYVTKQTAESGNSCDLHFAGNQRVPHVGAGNMAVRRSVFLELGGFDPELPIHEDVDLCIRARLAGYALTLCPEAVMYIRARIGLGSFFRQGRVWGYWSVALQKKHTGILGGQRVIRPVLGWGRLFFQLLFVRNRRDFFQWMYRLGWRIGRLVGSCAMGFMAL
jgi:glycosyltransferase involved in cell wall biosynthesis